MTAATLMTIRGGVVEHLVAFNARIVGGHKGATEATRIVKANACELKQKRVGRRKEH